LVERPEEGDDVADLGIAQWRPLTAMSAERRVGHVDIALIAARQIVGHAVRIEPPGRDIAQVIEVEYLAQPMKATVATELARMADNPDPTPTPRPMRASKQSQVTYR
jgi:hypothetical protein